MLSLIETALKTIFDNNGHNRVYETLKGENNKHGILKRGVKCGGVLPLSLSNHYVSETFMVH